MTLFYQFISTAIICFACTNLGIIFAFPSSTIKLFSSENTALDRIMTETELSFLGSIASASPLITTPFCGYLIDRLGRKRTLMLFCVPQLLSWAVLTTLLRVKAVIFSMALCGVSSSILLIAFVYIQEYCDSSIRGALSSSPVIFNGIGVLISYLIGGVLEYNIMNYTGLVLNIVSIVLICFLKESPLYLMKKGLEKEAAQSIAFFKGVKPNSVEVITEIENIKRIINFDIKLRNTPEMEELNPKENQPTKEKLPIRIYLMKSRSSRRALITVLVLCTICIFQGIIVVQIFAGPLFEAAVPSFTPTLLSIMFAIITVVAGGIGAYLTDRMGRRLLLITTSVATGVLCVILGTNLQLNWAPSWLTVILIYIYTFTFSMGPGTVPYVLIGEVFLPEIKGFASTASLQWCSLCNFSVLYMFVPVFNAYGLGPLFYFFGGCSFVTALFSVFYLPETKNLPVDAIQQKFLKRIKY